MKQRLAIAAGLLTPRQLIILDEPTNGLDPQGTREVRALIREIAADGTTVFVSSHLLAEVEQVCSGVGVMRTGRLVFQGPLEELRRTGAAPGSGCRPPIPPRPPPCSARRLGLPDPQIAGEEVTAPLGDFSARTDLRGSCPRRDRGSAAWASPAPSLEDLFVGLTGEGFDVDG